MIFHAIAVLTAAGLTSALLTYLLWPALNQYALARPNARSSHQVPTPQGGGIAVMLAVLAVLTATDLFIPQVYTAPERLTVVLIASIILAVVGAIDDVRPIEPWPRLFLQAIAVAVVIAALPAGLRIVPMLPWWVERALMGIGVLWLVNLVNFMDGIDLITVAEVVPITAALAVFGWIGAFPADGTIAAIALCGAILGFAPFNKPVARLFLGDVGSLPLGLLMGWFLIQLAEHHLVAAALLPLYYLADASITLLRRAARGEPVMQAHRDHFYQRAIDGGHSIYAIVGSIFALNVLLAALAAATIQLSVLAVQAVCMIAGAAAVAAELAWLSQNRSRT